MFFYPIDAPFTIFLSISCAVVTSLETTYAWIGCCVCPPIAVANWFVSLAPTTLNDGGIGAEPPPPDGLGDGDGGEPPAFNPLKPFAVAAIFVAILIPAAILFAVTNFAANATDAPPVGIANAEPWAIVAAFDACVCIIVLAIPIALSPIIAAACNALLSPAILPSNAKPPAILFKFESCIAFFCSTSIFAILTSSSAFSFIFLNLSASFSSNTFFLSASFSSCIFCSSSFLNFSSSSIAFNLAFSSLFAATIWDVTSLAFVNLAVSKSINLAFKLASSSKSSLVDFDNLFS